MTKISLSDPTWYYLLDEPIEVLGARFASPPTWLAELAQAFVCLGVTVGIQNWGAILDGIGPLINYGSERVHHDVQGLPRTHSDLPFDPDTVETVVFANLAEFFDEPAMSQVTRSLGLLSNNDLTQQLWFVRSGLAALSMDANRPLSSFYTRPKRVLVHDNSPLAAARTVGDQIRKCQRKWMALR